MKRFDRRRVKPEVPPKPREMYLTLGFEMDSPEAKLQGLGDPAVYLAAFYSVRRKRAQSRKK